MMAGGLGRRPEFDEKSKGFSVRTLLGPRTTTLPEKGRTWTCTSVLDQGNEGSCVGHGFAHELIASPAPVKTIDHDDAVKFYKAAQKVDQWPGESYSGTSVLAGAKALTSRGWYGEYRWAFDWTDALHALVNIGPIVIGVNWYEGMDTPRHVHDREAPWITASGAVRGGHCVAVIGYLKYRNAVKIINSWGEGWGLKGRALLSVGDFKRILEEDGECCVPLRRRVDGRVTVPSHR